MGDTLEVMRTKAQLLGVQVRQHTYGVTWVMHNANQYTHALSHVELFLTEQKALAELFRCMEKYPRKRDG